MKILLINPPWQRFFGLTLSTPAIAINHIASYIEKELPQYIIDVYDADQSEEASFSFDNYRYTFEHSDYVRRLNDLDGPIWHEIRSVIRNFNPDVIGVSAMTATYVSALNVSKVAKELNPQVIVVFGGRHPSVLPEDTLRNKTVDYVVVGEGEMTFRELLANLENPGDVKGIAYRKSDGSVVRTPPRVHIKDINELPIPVFESSINKCDYKNFKNAELYVWYLIGARGCPFECIYCASDKVVRYRSLEHIMKEIVYVKKKYGIKQFSFVDDSFSLSRNRALELCKYLKDEGVKWRCNTRVDLVDEEMVSAMKKSGCLSTAVGIETGSPKTMEIIKKNISYDKIVTALDLFGKYNIPVAGYFMIGFPWETRDDMEQTLEFIQRLSLDDFQLNIATPLPGTQLFQSLVDTGKIRIDTEVWSRYQQGSPYMNFSEFSDDEWSGMIIEFTRKASRIYRKKKIRRMLKNFINDPLQFTKVARYVVGRMAGCRRF